jgi:uncharacterized protein (TIGR02246 family)
MNGTPDADAIRGLIENWAAAVRAKDFAGIMANHAADIVMFDVPPPFVSRGIAAYRKTWDVFYGAAGDPVVFDLDDLTVTAGSDVAFAVALMHCFTIEKTGEKITLPFRVTFGLRKIDGRWTIVHEHHSIPAD